MDTRRELISIRENLDRYHRSIGEDVRWAAYDPASSTEDDVYDEPGVRAYFTPVYVQTLWIRLVEGGLINTNPDRLDPRNNLTLALSAEALRNAGVANPFAEDVRIFDIFKYWDRYWSIMDWEVLGRMPQADSSTIGARAVEIDLRSDYANEAALALE